MTPKEREKFYIRATSLARLRIAKDVLADVCPDPANGIKKAEWVKALRWIDGQIVRLEELMDEDDEK